MMWKMIGTFRGRSNVEVMWEDGELTGDGEMIDDMIAFAKLLEKDGVAFGGLPPDPGVRKDHLKDGMASCAIASELYDEIDGSESDQPYGEDDWEEGEEPPMY